MFAAPNTFFTGTSPALQTYTFPGGTSTWTAPTGVTSILIATGKGAAGSPSSSGSTSVYITWDVATDTTGPYTNAPYAQWADLYNAANANISALNAGGSGTRAMPSGLYNTRTNLISTNYYNGPNNFGVSYAGDSQTITGTFSYTTYRSPLTSGNILYSYVSPSGGTQSSGWLINLPYDYVVNATTGDSTTGFGKTFPGGTGGAASDTTFNNVAVTPGTTYTIVNNGALTIQYYAP